MVSIPSFHKLVQNLQKKYQQQTPVESFLPERNETDFKFSKISKMDILKVCQELKPKSSLVLIVFPQNYLKNLHQ